MKKHRLFWAIMAALALVGFTGCGKDDDYIGIVYGYYFQFQTITYKKL